MKKLTTIFGIALIAILLLAVTMALALTSWSKTFTWSYNSNTQFQVYASDKVTIWSPGTENLGFISNNPRADFWVENTGNVPIIVKAVDTALSNAIVTWNSSRAQSLAVGQSKWFNLTIMLINIANATGGLYSFNFALGP